MRWAVVFGAVGGAAVAGLLGWIMLRDGGGSGVDVSAPRFRSLEELAGRLGELGYGCDDYTPTALEPDGAPVAEERSAAGYCTFGEIPIDLSEFSDTAHQRRFRELGERFACVGAGEGIHYVNGNLWIVELVSPDPGRRDPDLVDRMARDMNAEHATIEC